MKLSALASQYVAYKQDMGMRFHTEPALSSHFAGPWVTLPWLKLCPTGCTPSSPVQAL